MREYIRNSSEASHGGDASLQAVFLFAHAVLLCLKQLNPQFTAAGSGSVSARSWHATGWRFYDALRWQTVLSAAAPLAGAQEKPCPVAAGGAAGAGGGPGAGGREGSGAAGSRGRAGAGGTGSGGGGGHFRGAGGRGAERRRAGAQQGAGMGVLHCKPLHRYSASVMRMLAAPLKQKWRL